MDDTDRQTSEHASPGRLLVLLRSQEVAYLVVGGINTAIGLTWFAVVHQVWGQYIGYMGSLFVAYALAILCAFVLHRSLVFRVHGHVLRDLARFTSVNLTALGINAVLLPVCVELVGLPVLPAQVVVTGLTVILSFFAHRSFSFARHSGPGFPSEPTFTDD